MRVVDLFCGSGGLSCGLHQAGMKPLAGFDKWEPALEVYARNLWVDHGRVRSISDFALVLPEILDLRPDLIAGGPPCQDFSTAGHRKEGANADRTRDFAYAICLVQPQWFIFENVAKASSSASYRDARRVWKAHGYGLTEVTLNAADYGVAQSRERFFCIGRRDEVDGFLEEDLLAAKQAKVTTIRDVCGDLIGDADAIYAPARYHNRQSMYSADGIAPTIRSASMRKIPEAYVDHENDAVGKRIRITREIASRIQGFPSSWEWAGLTRKVKKGDVDLMIANAVPPPLARAIGQVILLRASGRSQPKIRGGFLERLIRVEKLSEASAKNVVARVRRAHRILGGRSYADLDRALSALENAHDFIDLDTRQQSDLRSALRFYHAMPYDRPHLQPPNKPVRRFDRIRLQNPVLPLTGYMSHVDVDKRPPTTLPGRLVHMTAVRSRIKPLNLNRKRVSDPTSPNSEFEDDE